MSDSRSESAMIAFLPADGSWCKQDFPHMTLVYAGALEELDPTNLNDMGKDAISAARVTGSFSLPVTGIQELGDALEEKVDALIFYPTPQLLVARNMVEKWNLSQHRDFLPHATIGPAGSAFADNVPLNTNNYSRSDRNRQTLPSSVFFDRIAVSWGDKNLVFNLNNFDY